jgi:hypothetical protein
MTAAVCLLLGPTGLPAQQQVQTKKPEQDPSQEPEQKLQQGMENEQTAKPSDPRAYSQIYLTTA